MEKKVDFQPNKSKGVAVVISQRPSRNKGFGTLPGHQPGCLTPHVSTCSVDIEGNYGRYEF
jgi:hypothetical protein